MGTEFAPDENAWNVHSCDTQILLPEHLILTICEEQVEVGFMRKSDQDPEKQNTNGASSEQLNKQFRAIINSTSSLGIVLLDHEARIIQQNDYFRNVIQREFGVATRPGDAVFDLIPSPRLKSRFRRDFAQVMTGKPVVRDFEIDLSSGKQIFNIAYNPVSISKEGIVGVSLFLQDVTERTLLERELKQHSANYSLMLNDIEHGVGLIDRNENVVYMNPAGAGIFGYSPDEILGMNLMDAVPEDECQAILDETAIRQAGVSSTYETRIIRRDGESRFIHVNAAPQQNEAGEIQSFAMFRDITEQREAEEKLEDSEKRLNNLFELSPDAIFIASTDNGQVVDANAAALRLTGYSLSELKTMNQSDVVPEEYSITSFKEFAKGEHSSTEVIKARVLRKDGKLIPVEIHARNIEILGVPHILGTFRDMSASHEEQELNRFQSQLLNAVHQAVIATDVRGRITYWNDQAERMYGWEAKDVIGTLLTNIAPKNETPVESFNRLRQLKPGQTWVGEGIAQRRDGSELPVLAHTSPIYDRQGKLIGTLGLTTDITARKEFEKSLKRARKTAEDASKAKSLFLANMSHEIRTPMNSILGFTELVSNKVKDKKQKEHLDAIKASATSLMRLINDVLDLSRIESGRLHLDIKPVRPREILNDIYNVFLMDAKSKNLELSIVVDQQIPNILMLDEIRFRQIAMNLIANAIKFTDHGFVSVSLKTTSNSSNRGKINLRMSVSDSGAGIPEEQQKSIFQAFVQVEKQDQSKYGGTGLGLAITNRLVNLMDGSIRLKSSSGSGSVFVVDLPEITIIEESHEEQRMKKQIINSIRFAPARVLLMEDEPFNRRLIREYLKDHPIELVEVVDGEKGIIEAKDFCPDLILLDLRMPVMDGYETMSELKKDDSLANIPVVVLSASLLEQEEHRALESGAAMFIRKPISRADLFESMSRFLDVLPPTA